MARKKPIELTKLVDDYCRRSDVSTGYQRQLHSAVSALRKSINRDTPTTADLNVANINKCIEQRTLSDHTRHNRRRYLSLLAKEAVRLGYLKSFDTESVFKVRRKRTIPKGYSLAQAKAIATTILKPPTKELGDWLADDYQIGVNRQAWWLAFVLASWDTGHVSDMRLLLKSELDFEGRVTRLRHKTGKLIRSQLSKAALLAIDKIQLPNVQEVFPRWCNCVSRKCVTVEFRRIAGAAKVGGSLKWFRSGSGTQVEIENPGQGHQHLSNSRRVFENNYLVQPLLVNQPILSPTPLIEIEGEA